MAGDMNASTIFAQANSPVFAYANGYVNASTLINGKGYWVRYAGSTAANVCGNPIASQSVDVISGWNMVGVYDKAVTAANITTTPAGILSSVFFGFANGYSQANILESGKGYWIRVTQNGTLNLPASVGKIAAQESFKPKSEWGRISITDAAGRSAALYLVPEDDIVTGDLPPVPPQGVFDVRFAADRFIEHGSAQIINLQSMTYPAVIEAVNTRLNITDAATGGKLFTAKVENGKRVFLTGEVGALRIESGLQPLEYALFQNYPNPFNPVTSIKFSLPAASALVTLKVYDALGRQAAVLVNEARESGLHEVQFNAAALSSGIYYYELRAGSFRDVKKFVLMK
jgi:hypothetical protein